MENVVNLEVTEPTSNPNEEIYLIEQQARKIVLLQWSAFAYAAEYPFLILLSPHLRKRMVSGGILAEARCWSDIFLCQTESFTGMKYPAFNFGSDFRKTNNWTNIGM